MEARLHGSGELGSLHVKVRQLGMNLANCLFEINPVVLERGRDADVPTRSQAPTRCFDFGPVYEPHQPRYSPELRVWKAVLQPDDLAMEVHGLT